MRIEPIKLKQQNKLIEDYRNNEPRIKPFFDYPAFGEWEHRYHDLQKRTFKRQELCDCLQMINSHWEAPETTRKNIDRLRHPDAVTIIGGQQASLLSGPMYTMNKIISIIHLAKQQEEELRVPVIPVFWIAGEDHDFAEVNHVYLQEEQQMQKYVLKQQVRSKTALSDIWMDHDKAKQWLDELFEKLPETNHTKTLYDEMNKCLTSSQTYVDFFAKLIYHFFPEEGLVLMDSGSKSIRQLESDFFVEMIESQPEISESVCDSLEQLQSLGYTIDLSVVPSDGHLFYYKDDERILLQRTDTGEWIGKQNEVHFTTEQLKQIAKLTPEQLSNNVVTRPLMQEMLFPNLAFIAGPGEIGYWSALKSAFHQLEMKMPPIVPRLSISVIDRAIEKALRDCQMNAEQVINGRVTDEKEAWLANTSYPCIKQIAQEAQKQIIDVHAPLRELAASMRDDLGAIAEKNLHYIQGHIQYLEKRLEKAWQSKHQHDLATFDILQCVLHPENGLQERIWNPLPWLNMYGISFASNLLRHSYTFRNSHYAVYL
ncbi:MULTISPECIES: bacillithiol biosynthesis cysteine-adding enzyme BshC [Clostridia]|uniref:bacillithiol biosynthesis cysteine-adding enzyme BshC n=1 Tax=Clostridia TaxID=186801 RepID=UPI000EA23479|nr:MULTISPECIES: bacillithiol biosynthesis cysteine-adding enzyme BshC [Clostridia]NBJ68501.1 bacillithiol biosynthesis cysteine-adding enzyme BshC [Roseburia sp. 1XD42-34]RKI81257.1 bacillithiol biosynthesis cysteine-adding enzyme BshC [Clostridium sp. 1xD42-85]